VAWRVKSFPADERWSLLRDIQYRFKELYRDKPLADLEAHNNAKRQRQIIEMEQRNEKRCALSYAKYKDHAMVTTEQGLTQLQAKHAAKTLGTTKDFYIEALRDQLRAREHVYDQTKLKDKLPAIGSNSTFEEVKRIEDGLKPLFALPLFARHSPTAALPTRERYQAVAPTELAKVLLVKYAKKMREEWVKLGDCMDKGDFTLPRRPVQEGRQNMARAPRAPRVRAPTQRQRAAVEGKEFEEEGAMWRVLDVAWSGDYQEMVVFYYDIGGVSEEELKGIEDTGDFALSEFGAVEVSAFKEVLKWNRASE